MPYCVECGVELAASEPECPLCHTPVMKKNYQIDTEQDLYPVTKQAPQPPKPASNIMGLFTILFILAGIISITVDVAPDSSADWAGIVLLSLSFAWLILAFPLLFLRKSIGAALTADMVTTASYLFLLDIITGYSGWGILASSSILTVTAILVVPTILRGGKGLFAAVLDGLILASYLLIIQEGYSDSKWFVELGLPISLLTTAFLAAVFFTASSIRRRRYRLSSLILVYIGLFNMGIDVLVSRFLDIQLHVSRWSSIVLMSSLAAALIIYLIYRVPRVRHALKKRLHL
ncbi:DUF6320 domain-containing protein [Salinispira pacifica]|uniref:Uncharacterized protein n=1 Tax=Salinispira pacifica TaxID=1307761 RepID=V5WHA3_9SPIO|nr:DUF6320 domain-containing protein [Salinispira pacifica]AHC15212.1 hypothetical protein L21SP2_1837 [Salinispira pacifica]